MQCSEVTTRGQAHLFSNICLIYFTLRGTFLVLGLFSLTSLDPSLRPLGHPLQPSMQDQAASQRDSLTFSPTLEESHSLSHFRSFMSE